MERFMGIGHDRVELADMLICESDYAPFNPQAYLQEYYTHLGAENRALLDFFDQAYAHIFTAVKKARIIEFGGGPTIYQLISAARHPVAIDFSDYLDANLDELATWLHDRPSQFVWDSFIQYVLEREGERTGPEQIRRRANLIRRKVARLLWCDARLPDPLGVEQRAPYDIVSANFVLEAISQDLGDWEALTDHVLTLVKPQGYLIICMVVGAHSYRVGDLHYPATPITPAIVAAKLRHRRFTVIMNQSVAAEQRERQGYDGIAMMVAQNVPPTHS